MENSGPASILAADGVLYGVEGGVNRTTKAAVVSLPLHRHLGHSGACLAVSSGTQHWQAVGIRCQAHSTGRQWVSGVRHRFCSVDRASELKRIDCIRT